MKYIFMVIFFFLSLNCFSQTLNIKSNYETSQYEIYSNENRIYSLPMGIFYGFQVADRKVFFIDCSNSRINRYGEICYFDTATQNLIYTGIMSGSVFYVNKKNDCIIVSSLFDTKEETDVSDIFNTGYNTKRYPLNMEIFSYTDFKKEKSYDFSTKIDMKQISFLYLEFEEKEKTKLIIQYGCLDSLYKIPIGSLDLKTLEFNCD